MTRKSTRKSFTETILCAGIIIPAAFLFAVAADLPHVLITMLTGLALSLLFRNAVKLTDRTVIYSVVVSMVAAVLFDYAFPMSDERFGYLSSFFHLNITVPVLLYLAAASTFFGLRRYSYAIAASAAVVALAFSGNVLHMPPETERFLVPGYFLQHFRALHVSCICLSSFFLLLACRNNVQVEIGRKMRKYRIRRRLLFICIAVMIIPASYGSYRLFLYFEESLRGLQNALLNPMFFKNRSSRTVFGESANLNQVISPEIMDNQAQIVIRALSRNEPGYLRGKTYTIYASGQWRQPKNVLTVTMRQRNSNGGDYKTFSINRKNKAKNSFDILISSKLVSKVLFLPGNFTQIDIIANSLRYTANGNVTFSDWITDGGYTVYRPENLSDSAWPRPEEPKAEDYTQLPDNLRQDLDRILAALPSLKSPGLKDQRRISILLDYFRSNFTYKIRRQPENPVDPVLAFLTETREGHCELYATAMVLLLRRLGIPARYITGFICAERHPSGAYYVARLGNAHAWAEAFDRDGKQWLTIEPTPPSGAPNYKHEWSVIESWTDIINKTLRQILSDMRRGYFARAIIAFLAGIWEFIVIIFHNRIRGPLLGLLIILTAVYYIRRRRRMKRVKHDFAVPDKIFIDLGNTYRKIQNRLKDKYEIDLSDSLTISDFIDALSASKMPETEKKRLSGLLREYEAMRYRKTPPAPEIYMDFKKRFHL
ncbi:MAG: transglutaminase-like domain-containing protein [Victivallaceae bacterium]|nr:transglutaminase-like domain-containing protein [Victivallaceae bacterium]